MIHPADLAGRADSFVGRTSSWHWYLKVIIFAKSDVYIGILRKGALASSMVPIVQVEETSGSSSAVSRFVEKMCNDCNILTYLRSVFVFD